MSNPPLVADARNTPRVPDRERAAAPWLALAGRGARGLWVGLVPVLATGVVLRYLVPTEAEAEGTWAAPLAQLGNAHETACAVVLFVGFVALTRYWSDWLPGNAEAVGRGKANLLGLALMLALGVGSALVLRFELGPYQVLSASMLPTLEPSDMIGGNRLAYGMPWARADHRAPQRGDIVVFERPQGVEGPDHFVKRVVGLPGDKITMNGPHPVINGEEVPSCDAGTYFLPIASGGGAVGRTYVEFLDGHPHLIISNRSAPWTKTYVVKPGEVFVLGDNRNNSSDSRYWNGGEGAGLKFDAIVARVQSWLFGVHRDGRRDLTRLPHPLELHVRLEGVDTAELRDNIRNCLANPPVSGTTGGPHGGS